MKFAQPSVHCQECGVDFPRNGSRQYYCKPCASYRRLTFDRVSKSSPQGAAKYAARKGKILAAGASRSVAAARSLHDHHAPIWLQWECHVSVPFAWAGSKNFTINRRIRSGESGFPERRSFQEKIIEALRSSLRGIRVQPRKTWIEIFIQKPHHKGDAVNFVDTICDAVKEAIGVDDKWFSIRRLDWEIVKTEPAIFIMVGQEAPGAMRSCFACGGIFSLDQFVGKTGKVCKGCIAGAGMTHR